MQMREDLAEPARDLLFVIGFSVAMFAGAILLIVLGLLIHEVASGEANATDSEKELEQLKRAYSDLDRRHTSYLKNEQGENK